MRSLYARFVLAFVPAWVVGICMSEVGVHSLTIGFLVTLLVIVTTMRATEPKRPWYRRERTRPSDSGER